MAQSRLRRVGYYALGGTIASVRSTGQGASPSLSATEIAASVPGLGKVAQIEARQFLQTASSEISVDDLLRLLREMRAAVRHGIEGLVLTQGTDTIEETSFVLDLLWEADVPIVITGAMRNPSLPGSEGPANLLSAVQLAASDEARGAGVLVCLNDEINAARYVHKTHTSSPSTFRSPGLGPIGWVSEGRPVLALRPTRRTHLAVPQGATIPPVALLRPGLADDGQLLRAVPDLGFSGAVIEAMGGGHLPSALLPLVDQMCRRMPVVLASRTGAGEVLTSTYGFAGGEIDLLARGLIRAGALDGLKARLLLMLALAAGHDRSAIAAAFELAGTTTGPVTAHTD